MSSATVPCGTFELRQSAAHGELVPWQVAIYTKLITSKRGQAYEVFQILASVFATVVFVISTYMQGTWELALEFVFSGIFLFDLLLRLAVFPDFFRQLFSRDTLIDIITIVPPIFFILFGTTVAGSVALFRVFRILRIFRISRQSALGFASPDEPYGRRGLYMALIEFGFSVLTLVFVAAAVFQLLENEGSDQKLKFHQCVYYIIVSITTVGYGDITPTNTLSEIYIAIFLIFTFVFMSLQSAKVLEAISLYSFGLRSYRLAERTRGVLIILADQNVDRIRKVINELGHPSHGVVERLNVLILGREKPSRELQSLLKTRAVRHSVKYRTGSSLNARDLRRVDICNMSAVVVLSSAWPTAEADDESILRSIAISSVAPRMPIILHLSSVRSLQNVSHLRATRVFCSEEATMKLLLLSTTVRGASTLVMNLTSHSPKLTNNDRISIGGTWVEEYHRGLEANISAVTVPDIMGERLDFARITSIIFQTFNAVCIAIWRKRASILQMAPLADKEWLDAGDILFVVTQEKRLVPKVHALLAGRNEPHRKVTDHEPRASAFVAPDVTLHFDLSDDAIPHTEKQPARSNEECIVYAADPSWSGHFVVAGNASSMPLCVQMVRKGHAALGVRNRVILLIVATDNEEVSKCASRHEGVFILKGECRQLRVLQRCALQKARCFLYLSQVPIDQNDREPQAPDYEAVPIYRVMKAHFPDVLVIVQLFHMLSAEFVMERRPGSSLIPENEALAAFYSPALASGSVFPASAFDAFPARTYFNPFLVDLLTMLTNIDSSRLPVLRQVDVPQECHDLPWNFCVDYMIRERQCMPIGLYRAQGYLQSPQPYVYTCPVADAIVFEADRLFVIDANINNYSNDS